MAVYATFVNPDPDSEFLCFFYLTPTREPTEILFMSRLDTGEKLWIRRNLIKGLRRFAYFERTCIKINRIPVSQILENADRASRGLEVRFSLLEGVYLPSDLPIAVAVVTSMSTVSNFVNVHEQPASHCTVQSPEPGGEAEGAPKPKAGFQPGGTTERVLLRQG